MVDGGSGPSDPRLSRGEFALFVVTVLVVCWVVASLSGLSPGDRELVDNDGYMRLLRVEELATTGAWFDPVSERSNAPYGEILHWTRPLDVYILTLSLPFRPFVGDDAVYYAAFINAPLLLILSGLAGVWAFGPLMRRTLVPVFALAHLALPLLVAYFGFGRADHHGLIFMLFVIALGFVLRLLDRPNRRSAVFLGITLAAGIWVSPEFLVPWALAAVTLSAVSAHRAEARLARAAGEAFLSAAAFSAVALAAERGTALLVVEYQRISVVHVVLASIVAFACLAYSHVLGQRFRTPSRWAILVGLGALGAVFLVALFPKFIGGPFVDFDPIVRERWLDRVTELLPLTFNEGPGLIIYRIAPVAIGFVALGFAIRRAGRGRGLERMLVLGGWLVLYSLLTVAQFRWAIFSHYLALVVLMIAFGPIYESLGEVRGAVMVRPLILALVLVLPLVGSSFDLEPRDSSVSCDLDDVVPVLQSMGTITILAEQDIGPNLLYRTSHDVVAAPYGNADAFHFLFDTMAETDLTAAQAALSERDIGLVLVCPGPGQLTYPVNPASSFYEALVDGPLPDFVAPVNLPSETDYLLFEVVG